MMIMANVSHVLLFIIVLPVHLPLSAHFVKRVIIYYFTFILLGTFLKAEKCYGCGDATNGGDGHCEVCSYTVSTFVCTTCKEKFF